MAGTCLLLDLDKLSLGVLTVLISDAPEKNRKKSKTANGQLAEMENFGQLTVASPLFYSTRVRQIPKYTPRINF